MRLRGPWIIRGAGLDTSVSSLSGTIPVRSGINITMNPYTFAPAIHHGRPGTDVWLAVPWAPAIPLDADHPAILLRNLLGSTVSYAVEWRHVNP